MNTGPWRPDETGQSREPRRRRWRIPRLRVSEPLALETTAERERLGRRLWFVEVVVIAVVVVLGLGFWHLQLVRGPYYARLADENLLRRERVRAPRGLVLDRTGEVLVANRPSYEVAIIREGITDREATLEWLAGVLGQPAEELATRLERHRGVPRFRPVVIADDIPLQAVAVIEARRLEHPGVVVQANAKRFYPNGALAAHVLGHVGEIDREQLRNQATDRFRLGDIVGKNGIEAEYNDLLGGQAGNRLTVVNSIGRVVSVVEEEPALPGMTVVLTLDARLQAAAEESLRDRSGAIVALDARTGEVLSLVSAPSFDPNSFAARFSAEAWTALVENPRRPMQNRATSARYPPGSIFKLVLASAGLESGTTSTRTAAFCPGGRTLYGRFFRCLGSHGSVRLQEALTYSCNTYFYDLGVRLGRERIVEMALALGLGAQTGIDLPNEDAGILPSDEWLASQGRRWYAGETVSISIGQGPIGVSPLQLAHMAATIATGIDSQPHLLARAEDSGDVSRGFSWSAATGAAPLGDATRRAVVSGMGGAVRAGSARAAYRPDITVGGKTGTAQVVATEAAGDTEDRPEALRNHAWFIGLAPLDDPRIVVAVLVEHGGSGGRVAAPIGGEMISTWLRLERADADTARPSVVTVARGATR